jgi:glycosyltransferase involved in cell wall biosynthesis
MTASPPRHPLRIAQVAPLFESVPPKLYGGTERVVSYLTEDLVRQGHSVTLFASGDSITAAELVSVCDRALRLDPAQPDAFALHALMLERVFRRAGSFDVIHFHTDGLHLPLARRCMGLCCVTTLHGRLDIPGLAALYQEFSEQPLISVSDAQRRPLPRANWAATIHHGVPPGLHAPTEVPGRYLAFLGRIAREKGIERAIAIARRTDIPLKIAAKIDPADRGYFEARIAPLIDGSLVEFVGEISEREKTRFLGDALALLFPIDWPEPFGLTMIEAMACGTPVIAFRCGAVPEVIDEGITGFIVDDLDKAVKCVERTSSLSRKRCRERFEQRFQVARMSRDYCSVYHLARQQLCRLTA